MNFFITGKRKLVDHSKLSFQTLPDYTESDTDKRNKIFGESARAHSKCSRCALLERRAKGSHGRSYEDTSISPNTNTKVNSIIW